MKMSISQLVRFPRNFSRTKSKIQGTKFHHIYDAVIIEKQYKSSKKLCFKLMFTNL